MRIKGSSIFTIFVGVFFLAMLIGTRKFSFGAMAFPAGISILCLILTIIQFIIDRKGEGESDEGQIYDIAPDRTSPAQLIYRKTGILFCWLLGLYLGIWLLGFKIGFFIFFLLFLKIDGRCSWKITTLLVVIMLFIVYTFEIALGVYWPEGLLQNYVKLPI